MTEQEVLETLENLEKKIERIATIAPPALLLKEDLGVCPQSLTTPDVQMALTTQTHCETYHTVPYKGAWLEQPNVTIEMFESIKEGSSLFTRWDMAVKENNEGTKKTVPVGKDRFKK